MARDSYVFYRTWLDTIRDLPKSLQLDAFYALTDYALDGKKLGNKNAAVRAVLLMAKKRIDEDCAKYNAIKEKRKEAANKRWERRKAEQETTDANEYSAMQKMQMHMQMHNLHSVYVNDNVNVNVNDNVNGNTTNVVLLDNNNLDIDNIKGDESKTNTAAARFIPPTVGEVDDYITSKHYHVNAEEFCAFYESKGWMVGKNKMKDWRAACRTWEAGYKKRNKGSTTHFAGETDRSVYDTDKEMAFWGQGL